MNQTLVPFVIAPWGTEQDLVIDGPRSWLAAAKATASTLYADQPNPRRDHASSFTFGRHLGYHLFARSYHLDVTETGTQRSGALLTLGLASTTLDPSTLCWLYRVGAAAILVSGSIHPGTAGATAEDDAIRAIFERLGSGSGEHLSTLMKGIYGQAPVLRSSGLSTRIEAFHKRVASGKAAAALLDMAAGRDALYSVATAVADRGRKAMHLLLGRAALNTVLVYRSDSTSDARLLVVGARRLTGGLAEISLTDLGGAGITSAAAIATREAEDVPIDADCRTEKTHAVRST